MKTENWGNEPDDTDKPTWKPILVVPKGIIVTYREKYGEEKIETCIGLWESDSEYLLTWLDSKKIILQKSNINTITYTKE